MLKSNNFIQHENLYYLGLNIPTFYFLVFVKLLNSFSCAYIVLHKILQFKVFHY